MKILIANGDDATRDRTEPERLKKGSAGLLRAGHAGDGQAVGKAQTGGTVRT